MPSVVGGSHGGEGSALGDGSALDEGSDGGGWQIAPVQARTAVTCAGESPPLQLAVGVAGSESVVQRERPP